VQEGIQAEGDKDGAQQDADDDDHDFHECSVYCNSKIRFEVYANRSLTSCFFGFTSEEFRQEGLCPQCGHGVVKWREQA
jgi:hypothetical protein